MPSLPSTARVRCRGCSSIPTPTRSGCPIRGSRSSTRSSTNARTPWPSGPMPRGWTWRRPCARRGFPSSPREPCAGPGLRRARLQPLRRARLHQRPQSHRPGRGAGPERGARPPPTRSWPPAATARSTPSRWPTSWTASSLGDGEEVVGEMNEVMAADRSAPAGPRLGRRHVLRRAAARGAGPVPGVYVPACYEAEYSRRPTRRRADSGRIRALAARLAGTRPRSADIPGRVEKRTIADLAQLALPAPTAGAAHRGGP